jgi:hypothetical protein
VEIRVIFKAPDSPIKIFGSCLNGEEDALLPLPFRPAFLLAPVLFLPYTLHIKKSSLYEGYKNDFCVPE